MCGYGALHDEMVWGRFVVGLRDKCLSEQLQMDPKLMQGKVVNRVQQSELLMANFKTDMSNTQLDNVHVRRCGTAHSMSYKSQHRWTGKPASQGRQTQCKRCGHTKCLHIQNVCTNAQQERQYIITAEKKDIMQEWAEIKYFVK